MNKPTVVLGANSNPEKYAYKAVDFLQGIGQIIYPVGIKPGEVLGLKIEQDFNHLSADNHVDTVSLYVGPQNQANWIKPIIDLKPKRVIFNPGTENPEFEELLEANGIEAIEACTLVMVRTGQY
jgi:predicted CoA-binding protein